VATNEIGNLLASQIHLSGGEGALSDFWPPIVLEAEGEAAAWMAMTLRGKGFRDEDVAQWPMYDHYRRRLALYWCGVWGSSQLSDADALRLKLMDPRAEVLALTTLGLTEADEDVDEDSAAVAVGRLQRDDDLFALPAVTAGGMTAGDVFRSATTGTVPSWWR
jgi:hypothetical protein